MQDLNCDVAVIGAGIVGIASAYYLSQLRPGVSIVMIESGQPMALTSAQSGENYRNWWPHPVMTAFTDHSINLMESLARETNNILQMTRRGYVLATRSDNASKLIDELYQGYEEHDHQAIRIHNTPTASNYQKPLTPDWSSAPSGVDVLNNQQLIRDTFPSYDTSVKTIVHIRRAGDISAQQMGQWMLERFKESGGKLIVSQVANINDNDGFLLFNGIGEKIVKAQQLVNAAGPYINEVAEMLNTRLPVSNVLQQKIAFEDVAGAIPRQLPFTIDLDSQSIDWTGEERALLSESTEHVWLTKELPGAIHCRPDGPDKGRWIKLGWAINDVASKPTREPQLLEHYPEIVLRAAARLNPGLETYYGKLPSRRHHYGGFYTLTDENWPLIGEMAIKGTFVVGALSGFGTMAACAAGDLCARNVLGLQLPEFAQALALSRYQNHSLMEGLRKVSQRGIL